MLIKKTIFTDSRKVSTIFPCSGKVPCSIIHGVIIIHCTYSVTPFSLRRYFTHREYIYLYIVKPTSSQVTMGRNYYLQIPSHIAALFLRSILCEKAESTVTALSMNNGSGPQTDQLIPSCFSLIFSLQLQCPEPPTSISVSCS